MIKLYYYLYAYWYAFASKRGSAQRAHSSAFGGSLLVLMFTLLTLLQGIDILLGKRVFTNAFVMMAIFVLLFLVHILMLGINGRGIKIERKMRKDVEAHKKIGYSLLAAYVIVLLSAFIVTGGLLQKL